MYTYDPAVKTYGLDRDDVGSKFNLTLTYQLDASYPLVFGQLRRRKLPEKAYDKIYQGKTNHTAWFVSHCTTWSKREIYVKRMRKLIPVDIYGGCSDRKCGVIHYRTSDNSLCLPMLSKQYKFYLAFENSFCKDYISEKFFKLFQEVDVIPVVRGGFDYKKYLPSGIFVDASDFKTPEDLAKYLLQLGSNQKEYVKMLKRKNSLYGQLASGSRIIGRLHLRYVDVTKRDLKTVDIETDHTAPDE
uniref:Fucosyltransferase n=1 Tax=Biomphalaria glabrata TaxID=6526 RepID=A0A2C9KT84_BIOGL